MDGSELVNKMYPLFRGASGRLWTDGSGWGVRRVMVTAAWEHTEEGLNGSEEMLDGLSSWVAGWLADLLTYMLVRLPSSPPACDRGPSLRESRASGSTDESLTITAKMISVTGFYRRW